jgi:hypothetical protein
MEAVIRFFIDIQGWVYLLAGVGILVSLFRLAIAFKKWRNAQFGLEREIARRKIIVAMTTGTLFFFVIVAELFFTSYASAKLVSIEMSATPTISLVSTPTVPFSLGQSGQTSQPIVTSGTATPEQSGCIPGQLEWLSPKANDQVRGSIQLIGTVNIVDLGFYKYQYRSVDSQNWITIAGGNTNIVEGELGGNWDTSSVMPGNYLLSLVVTDNQAHELPDCEIPIQILAP